MKIDGPLRIGDLSKRAGIKVVTIRYYEQNQPHAGAAAHGWKLSGL
jgi:hypothetical protein